MLDRTETDVYIQGGPVEVSRRGFFYVDNFSHGGVSEPGEVLVREENFPTAGKEPNAVRGYVGDLNHRSIAAKRL